MPIRVLFKSINYRAILGTSSALLLFLLVQLRVSSRARQWTKSLVHGLMFGSAFFGLLITVIIALLKFKLQKKEKKEISGGASGYEDDDSGQN
jgi:uncharacterized membrane protein